jgi:hypothetical protein
MIDELYQTAGCTKVVLPPNVPNHDRCKFTKDVTAITIAKDSCLEFVNSKQIIGGHYQRASSMMQGATFKCVI